MRKGNDIRISIVHLEQSHVRIQSIFARWKCGKWCDCRREERRAVAEGDGRAAKNNIAHRSGNDVGMSAFTTSNLYIMNYVN